MELTSNEVSGVTLVNLRGEINSATSGDVMDALVELVKDGAKKLLLNVQDVNYISSAGLRSILVASKVLKHSGGPMNICNANESVARVLETSGFTSLVSIYSDESAAMAAFN